MRGATVLAAVLLALAGCAAPPTGAPGQATCDDGPKAAHGPGLARHPNDRVGTQALVPEGPCGSWSRLCALAWTTGAHDYHTPPDVAGRPCRTLPTADGNLTFLEVPEQQGRVTGAPLVNGTGADWVLYLAAEGELRWQPNGTRESTKVVGGFAVQPARSMSAVRLLDGTIHVLLSLDAGQVDVVRLALGSVHHFWWRPGDAQVAHEEWDSAQVYRARPIRTDGQNLAFLMEERTTVTPMVSRGGAFEMLALPGRASALEVTNGWLYVVHGLADAVLLQQWPFGEGLPSTSVVGFHPLASVYHQAAVTTSARGPVVVATLSGTPAGPLALQAATLHGGTWQYTTISATDEFGLEAVDVAGVPYLRYHTANGTASGKWRNDTWVMVPDGGDPTQAWRNVWGNHDVGAFLQDLDARRLLMVGDFLNPPFRYGWERRETETGLTPGLVVLQAPPPKP